MFWFEPSVSFEYQVTTNPPPVNPVTVECSWRLGLVVTAISPPTLLPEASNRWAKTSQAALGGPDQDTTKPPAAPPLALVERAAMLGVNCSPAVVVFTVNVPCPTPDT